MSYQFVGEIYLVGFNFAPQGWAFCDGSLMSIANNDVLFTLIGTTYGGDGQTTFALPNLTGRAVVHQGVSASSGNNYILGLTGGAATVTLTTPQMPGHTHLIACQTAGGAATTPTGGYFASATPAVYATPVNYVAMGSTVSAAGSNLPHDNTQPYMAMNYIISLYGIYPSQN